MSPPLISVLITTYNYGRFIEGSIDSVLSQDFLPDQLEVVVVDDGSTDDTAERVRKYDSRVQYFYQPNGGQASALNFGFAMARGEIIFLLDGDDVLSTGESRPRGGGVSTRPSPWHGLSPDAGMERGN